MSAEIATERQYPPSFRVRRDEFPQLPHEYFLPRWYAIYTSANHEKRVGQQLSERQIENFVPLYESSRRWKDRRVTLQMPLFPGYLFVRLALRDRLSVVQIAGVARLVGFNGTPTALAEEEIVALQTGLRSGMKAQPHPFLTVGRSVRVNDGPFSGLTGILIRRKGKSRVVVSIQLLRQSIAIEVPDWDLKAEN